VKKNRSKATNSVRIIGGKWRGRKIGVCKETSVRPTPDRVKETLFNWLTALLPGASCLDLFAGTGALGFESLSRGAKKAWFIENDPTLYRALEKQKISFNANARLIKADALKVISEVTCRPFDIIFLDPPYEMDLSAVLLQLQFWLRDSSLIYVERNAMPDKCPITSLAEVNPSMSIWKKGAAGQVVFGLFKFKE
tara:strand:+ start:157 stop:741 length:585 start_codon:yes stop_codon:yes gene_type:complete